MKKTLRLSRFVPPVALICALSPQLCFSVENGCLSKFLRRSIGIGAGWDNSSFLPKHFEPESYADAKRILTISDARMENSYGISIGERVAEAFPDKTVVSTDFMNGDSHSSGNLTRMRLDNTEPFPFADDSFDRISMRLGLCECRMGQCCGGFAPVSPEAKRFFREVARVLDKRDPNSIAILHGQGRFVKPEVISEWRKYLSEIEGAFGLEATLVFIRETPVEGNGSLGEFSMITLKPKKPQ